VQDAPVPPALWGESDFRVGFAIMARGQRFWHPEVAFLLLSSDGLQGPGRAARKPGMSLGSR
jgi:hypothetical protein